MSEAAHELPDSDDPFEILGISRDVGEDELKSAYARMIRRFRPDRSPQEFQRVQQAYENARSLIQWSAHADEWDDEDEEAEASAEAADDAPLSHDLWTPLEEEPSAPTPGDEVIQTFLAARRRGIPLNTALEAVTDAVRNGVPVIGAMVDNQDEPEILDAAGSPLLRLDNLDSQPDAERCAFMHVRAEELLINDRLQDLVDDLDSESFKALARSQPLLPSLATHAAVALVWTMPDHADRLMAMWDDATTGWDHAADEFDQRKPLRAAWNTCIAEGVFVNGMARLLALDPALSKSGTQRVAAEFFSDLAENPDRILFSLDRMIAIEPDLFHAWMVVIGTEDEPPEPDEAAVREMEAFHDGTDESLRHQSKNAATRISGIIFSIATIRLFMIGILWGSISLAIGVIFFGWSAIRKDAVLYPSVVRPRAARLIVRAGVSVQQLIAHIKSKTKFSDDIGRFRGELRDDAVLNSVAEIMTYRRWLEE